MSERLLVQVRMEEGLIQKLDAYREAQGRFLPPRSEVIVTALNEWLDQQRAGQPVALAPAPVLSVPSPTEEPVTQGNGTAPQAVVSQVGAPAAPSLPRQAVLDLIHQWHREGKGAVKITQELKARNIPTFSGLPTWTSGVVGRLLGKGKEKRL